MPALKPLTVIGLNSGTSMDGVDAAIFKFTPLKSATNGGNGHSVSLQLDIDMVDSLLYPISAELREKMQSMISSGTCTLDDVCRLNVAIGEVFGEAANAVIKKAKLSNNEIDLIGSHGQTVWHAPENKNFAGVETHGTLQLGEAAVIASRTGIAVVSNFRPRDMANGGQGAPLVSFADEVLFGAEGVPTAILNIGGISNITILNEHGEAVMAFDTGPGNMLIDRIVEKLFGRQFDEDGKIAASGTIDKEWLDALLAQPYYKQRPPKTTGRELYTFAYADKLIEEGQALKLSNEDIAATVTALTAASIAQAYRVFVMDQFKVHTLVLGGGGADNPTLVKGIQSYWPDTKLKVKRHEDYGISTKFKEALLFALLAYTTHFGIPNNVPRCTGASSRVCLGTISRA